MQALHMLNDGHQDEDGLSNKEINYLLMDLNDKIDIKIAQTTLNEKKKGTQKDDALVGNSILLARMDTREFTKQVIQQLPNIFKTLETLFSEIQGQDAEAGRVAEESKDIAEGMSIIFNILLKLLSWSDIQDHTNADLLEDIISAIAGRIDEGREDSPFQVKLAKAAHYLSCYNTNMPQFNTATVLFKIILQLMSFSRNKDALKKDAVKVVDAIMSTSWLDWREHKKEVPFLLEQSIKLNQDPLNVIENLVNTVLPDYEENGNLEDYPFLVEETTPQYCQAIIHQIIESLDTLSTEDEELFLVQNARIAKSFERITEYIKVKDKRPLFAVLLKSSRLYVEHYMKISIPAFTKIFRANMEEIVGIFKDFQTSTRSLQIICSHVKAMKDVRLSTFVPPLKKALENVIYQVKMLLIKNNAPSEAFFLGALKHRDIRGAEISSQIPRESESEASSDEEVNLKDSAPHLQCVSPKKKKKKSKTTTANNRKRKQDAQSYRTSSVVPSSDDDDEETGDDMEQEAERDGTDVEIEFDMLSEDDGAASVNDVKPEYSSPEPSPIREEQQTDDDDEEEEEEERVHNSKKKRRKIHQRG